MNTIRTEILEKINEIRSFDLFDYRVWGFFKEGLAKLEKLKNRQSEMVMKTVLDVIDCFLFVSNRCNRETEMHNLEITAYEMMGYCCLLFSFNNSNPRYLSMLMEKWGRILDPALISVSMVERTVTNTKSILSLIFDHVYLGGNYMTQYNGLAVLVKYLKPFHGQALDQILTEFSNKDIIPYLIKLVNNTTKHQFTAFRQFLNKLNLQFSNEISVYPVEALEIKMNNFLNVGNVLLNMNRKTVEPLWVDFNAKTKSISFFCSPITFALHENIEYIYFEMQADIIQYDEMSDIIITSNTEPIVLPQYVKTLKPIISNIRSLNLKFNKTNLDNILDNHIIPYMKFFDITTISNISATKIGFKNFRTFLAADQLQLYSNFAQENNGRFDNSLESALVKVTKTPQKNNEENDSTESSSELSTTTTTTFDGSSAYEPKQKNPVGKKPTKQNLNKAKNLKKLAPVKKGMQNSPTGNENLYFIDENGVRQRRIPKLILYNNRNGNYSHIKSGSDLENNTVIRVYNTPKKPRKTKKNATVVSHGNDDAITANQQQTKSRQKAPADYNTDESNINNGELVNYDNDSISSEPQYTMKRKITVEEKIKSTSKNPELKKKRKNTKKSIFEIEQSNDEYLGSMTGADKKVTKKSMWDMDLEEFNKTMDESQNTSFHLLEERLGQRTQLPTNTRKKNKRPPVATIVKYNDNHEYQCNDSSSISDDSILPETRALIPITDKLKNKFVNNRYSDSMSDKLDQENNISLPDQTRNALHKYSFVSPIYQTGNYNTNCSSDNSDIESDPLIDIISLDSSEINTKKKSQLRKQKNPTFISNNENDFEKEIFDNFPTGTKSFVEEQNWNFSSNAINQNITSAQNAFKKDITTAPIEEYKNKIENFSASNYEKYLNTKYPNDFRNVNDEASNIYIKINQYFNNVVNLHQKLKAKREEMTNDLIILADTIKKCLEMIRNDIIKKIEPVWNSSDDNIKNINRSFENFNEHFENYCKREAEDIWRKKLDNLLQSFTEIFHNNYKLNVDDGSTETKDPNEN